MQGLFQNVVEVALSSSVLIAVLLLLLPLIHKKYTAKWRYWVWLVLAVRLLVPFSPSLPRTPIEITPPSQNIVLSVPMQNAIALPLTDHTAVAQAAVRTMTLNEILSIVWVLGIAVFLLYHLAGYFLFKRSVLRFSTPMKDGRTVGVWNETREEMKTGQDIRLLSCKKVKSPMMTGFFHPMLLLPDFHYSEDDLKIILKHELIHYKRKDIWYKLVLICANAVHWFNPLVYLMTAMSNKDIEMACDSEVIRGSDTAFRKQYSETILSTIQKGNQRRLAFSTNFYGGKKTMKERFINIFDMSKKRKGIAALCAISVIVVISGAAIAYGAVTDFTIVDTDKFSVSLPKDWTVESASDGTLSFRDKNGEIGSFSTLSGDGSLQGFLGNHAEILSTKQLNGLHYPATEVLARRTQPAAAMDNSYVDELHIYLIPGNDGIAYDLFFDSSKVDEKTAAEIAKSFQLNTESKQASDGQNSSGVNSSNSETKSSPSSLSGTSSNTETGNPLSSSSASSSSTAVESFLSGTEGQSFQIAAKKFTTAYLSGDINTVKSYLADPQNKQNSFYTENRLNDVKSLVLKLGPEGIQEDSVSAEYEFMLNGDVGYTYLSLNMKKINGEWKVESYGLEK